MYINPYIRTKHIHNYVHVHMYMYVHVHMYMYVICTHVFNTMYVTTYVHCICISVVLVLLGLISMVYPKFTIQYNTLLH